MVAYLEAVDELAKRRQIQVWVEVFISLFGLEFESISIMLLQLILTCFQQVSLKNVRESDSEHVKYVNT